MNHACTVLLAFAAACAPSPESPAAAGAWFKEGAAAGLVFEHVSGANGKYHFPEIMGGGVGLLDFDGDGLLDVYFVQSGSLGADPAALGNRLFRNLGGGRFEDCTERAGVGDRGYGMGCACGDYDGDGDTDLYVTNVGPNVLYENLGDGTFRDATEAAAVGHAGWGTSAAFLDYDDDGRLDLFVANYLEWSTEHELTCESADGRRDYCHPNHYSAPAPDVLYHNEGGGRFSDATQVRGIGRAFGNGLGVACADFDSDGRTDIFVANDMRPNLLWLNRGGRFEEAAMLHGCALSGAGYPEAGMGVQAFDLEEDGDLELLVSHMRHQKATLYRFDQEAFEDASAALGLALATRPYTGFGLGVCDFDGDGRLDVYLANGRVAQEPPFASALDRYAEENLLFTQAEDGRFVEVLPRGGVEPALIATSRGAAFGDLDEDGDIDIVVVNRDGRAHLLWNRIGRREDFLVFQVLERGGALAVGAKVEVVAAGRKQSRRVDPAWSYCSSNDPRAHFGLAGARAAERVSVRWSDGTSEDFGPREAGRSWILKRGEGQAAGTPAALHVR